MTINANMAEQCCIVGLYENIKITYYAIVIYRNNYLCNIIYIIIWDRQTYLVCIFWSIEKIFFILFGLDKSDNSPFDAAFYFSRNICPKLLFP